MLRYVYNFIYCSNTTHITQYTQYYVIATIMNHYKIKLIWILCCFLIKYIIMTIPHLFIFKFVMNIFNVMLRGDALHNQCFKHPPFEHSICV